MLVESGRCEKHGGPALSWRQTPAKPHVEARIRGTRLTELRQQLFAEEPLCRECSKAGRTTIATVRDHIVNLAEGGTEDRSNIQPLCEDCHLAKTAEESRRGIRRSW